MFAKLAPGGNLLLSDTGLLGGQKPGAGLASHRLSQAMVRAVAGLGVVGASAARLATPNRALGQRTAAHGLRLSQFVGELADTGRDFGRDGHGPILRHNMP